MPIIRYSYRLKREVAMLSDEEYLPVQQALWERLAAVKEYRVEHRASIEVAQRNVHPVSIAYYERLTGQRLVSVNDLYHVQNSRFGSDCSSCQKPLRTPRAKMCAECGFQVE